MDTAKFIDTYLERERFTFIDRPFLRFCNPVTVKILIVVDGSISFSTSGFGLGLVLDTLRDPAYNYVRFELDLATRDGSPATTPNPGPYQTRYNGFRFDQSDEGTPIIDNYDQVWLFGFAPGNDAGPDANIENDSRSLSELELIRLTEWMNTHQGGLLAMGDHDYLGATMCWKIPRIRYMRRWTNAQNVPPIGGAANPDTHLRHDTNQPLIPGQLAGTDTIFFSAQGDIKPQKIDVKRKPIGRGPLYWLRNYEPHPILCSRKYGVIDILPDHPHEGWVYEDDEIMPDTNYSWSESGESVSGDDFPVVSGHREMPEVIAWAWTTPNPPYLLAKGPSPRKRFGVIGAYDGHRANVGRVATDATWHHWFSENLVGMKNDTTTNHYEMLQDYYRNVAVWLSPPSKQSAMFSVSAWNSLFTVQGMQELGPIHYSPFLIGPSAKDVVGRLVPKCTLRQWIWDFVLPEIYPWWRDIIGDPCLSCPPFELLEDGALGFLIREMLTLREQSIEKDLNGKKLEQAVHKVFSKAINQAAPELMKELDKELSKQSKKFSELTRSIKGTKPKHECN